MFHCIDGTAMARDNGICNNKDDNTKTGYTFRGIGVNKISYCNVVTWNNVTLTLPMEEGKRWKAMETHRKYTLQSNKY